MGLFQSTDFRPTVWYHRDTGRNPHVWLPHYNVTRSEDCLERIDLTSVIRKRDNVYMSKNSGIRNYLYTWKIKNGVIHFFPASLPGIETETQVIA